MCVCVNQTLVGTHSTQSQGFGLRVCKRNCTWVYRQVFSVEGLGTAPIDDGTSECKHMCFECSEANPELS